MLTMPQNHDYLMNKCFFYRRKLGKVHVGKLEYEALHVISQCW